MTSPTPLLQVLSEHRYANICDPHGYVLLVNSGQRVSGISVSGDRGDSQKNLGAEVSSLILSLIPKQEIPGWICMVPTKACVIPVSQEGLEFKAVSKGKKQASSAKLEISD